MPKLTKSQRDAIAEHLSFPIGSVSLVADGRKVTLQMHRWGKGRVFYCSIGHNHDMYWHPKVLRHYLAGIQWALGDLEVDVKSGD